MSVIIITEVVSKLLTSKDSIFSQAKNIPFIYFRAGVLKLLKSIDDIFLHPENISFIDSTISVLKDPFKFKDNNDSQS